MLNDTRISAGDDRLEDGKLTLSDVDNMASAFRLLVGPLETVYNYKFVSDLEALDDTVNDRQKAAKIAGVLIVLNTEDFDTDKLDGDYKSDANIYRELLIIYAFSILYPIPTELMSNEAYKRYLLKPASTSSFRRITVL